jgi:hypothetical protein
VVINETIVVNENVNVNENENVNENVNVNDKIKLKILITRLNNVMNKFTQKYNKKIFLYWAKKIKFFLKRLKK